MSNFKLFPSFLQEDVYANSLNSAKHVYSTGENVFYSNKCWGYGIVKDSFPVLIHKINDNNRLHTDLKQCIEDKTSMYVNRPLMFYYWTRFSYIPWHVDLEYDGALTIFLNEDWHEDFGGYFLYKEEKEIKAIVPQRNLATFQSNGLEHCTTPVNYDGEVRMTIQVFLHKTKEGV
jgi:hypothetical protein